MEAVLVDGAVLHPVAMEVVLVDTAVPLLVAIAVEVQAPMAAKEEGMEVHTATREVAEGSPPGGKPLTLATFRSRPNSILSVARPAYLLDRSLFLFNVIFGGFFS